MGAIVLMPIVSKTRIGRYYRRTVPREVKRLLELKENDVVEWVLENGKVFIRKAQG